MKTARLLSALIFCTTIFIAAPGMAQRYGHADRKGVWRDAGYWHANHPEWVYRYHPEWVVEREEWWQADHERHPEWFAYPFWAEYPVWTYGAYDEHHVWRYAGWWHRHDPAWFYANHPRWAEPYPGWIRADHGRHPEWFRSAYWHEHPRDWNHPEAKFNQVVSRNARAKLGGKTIVDYLPPHGPTGPKPPNHPPNQLGVNKPAVHASPPNSATHTVSSSASKTASSVKH
ncbi:MAG: hypothetical protein ABSD31_10140 [Candidatus Binataceae bacterium]